MSNNLSFGLLEILIGPHKRTNLPAIQCNKWGTLSGLIVVQNVKFLEGLTSDKTKTTIQCEEPQNVLN